MNVSELEHQWTALWERLAKRCCKAEAFDLKAVQRGGKRLRKAYASRGRHYHTQAHLSALFVLWQQHHHALRDPDTVALAIWYHDAVYQSLRKDNEKRSAQWAQRDLSAWGLAAEKIKTVVKMIEVTAHHHQVPEPVNHDLLWFLDFDLNILSAPPETYSRYVEQVRKEYRWVPEALYRQGRVKVLKTMLAADFIYHTPTFRQQKERQARENVRKEIAYWNHLYA